MSFHRDDRPSARLHVWVADALVNAYSKSLDWEMIEPILDQVSVFHNKLIERANRRPEGAFGIGIDYHTHIPEVRFYLGDEEGNAVLESTRPFEDVVRAEYPDCMGSQAEVLFALDESLAKLKAQFEEDFGVPFDRKAIDAAFKAGWQWKG